VCSFTHTSKQIFAHCFTCTTTFQLPSSSHLLSHALTKQICSCFQNFNLMLHIHVHMKLYLPFTHACKHSFILSICYNCTSSSTYQHTLLHLFLCMCMFFNVVPSVRHFLIYWSIFQIIYLEFTVEYILVLIIEDRFSNS
jgi:hypothetical protein